MSSSNDDMLSYQNLRNNLPEQPMMPSAPIYDIVPCVKNLQDIKVNERREEMIPVRASPALDARKKLRIETEIKKAQLKKEQLLKERQIMEEEFKAKEMLLDAEFELVLTTLDGTEDGASKPCTSNGVHHLDNNTIHNYSAQSQVFKLENSTLNANKIERPVELPKQIGLEQLSVLDNVTIRQLVSTAVDESYEVVAPGDVVILRANLTFGLADTPLHGQRRIIKVDMFDNEVNELVNFRAGATKSMEVYVNSQLVSLIRRVPTYFKPMLMLHDSKTRPVLKIKGPSTGSNRNVFLVQTIDKLNIGSMDKTPKFVGAGYVAANHTNLHFPLDLDARFKAAIIASSFLIVTRETVKIRERRLQAAFMNKTVQYLTSD